MDACFILKHTGIVDSDAERGVGSGSTLFTSHLAGLRHINIVNRYVQILEYKTNKGSII